MESALLRKRKPRAYLVPSPTNKSVPSHPFKPTINKRSKQMAARLRPAELSPHDILHYNAEAVRVCVCFCVCIRVIIRMCTLSLRPTELLLMISCTTTQKRCVCVLCVCIRVFTHIRIYACAC